jgi:hypothetical protein
MPASRRLLGKSAQATDPTAPPGCDRRRIEGLHKRNRTGRNVGGVRVHRGDTEEGRWRGLWCAFCGDREDIEVCSFHRQQSPLLVLHLHSKCFLRTFYIACFFIFCPSSLMCSLHIVSDPPIAPPPPSTQPRRPPPFVDFIPFRRLTYSPHSSFLSALVPPLPSPLLPCFHDIPSTLVATHPIHASSSYTPCL